MHRGLSQHVRSSRQVARKALLCLGTLGVIGACISQAAPASATPISPSTSDCSYSNATTPANSAAVLGVTPGSTITISCAAGSFAASSTLVLIEASGLAAVVSPSSAELSDLDLSALGVGSAGADGSLSTTFTVPTSFSASDPNAACPPTQAQINIGLTCDLVMVSLSGLQPVNEAMLDYAGQGTPNRPTLQATVTDEHHGQKTITFSDAPGACATPPTADSRCWWGAPVTGTPSTAFSGIPAPEALVGRRILTGTLAVSPAVYCQTGATATACASVPVGTLIPPALSGSVTTRHGFGFGFEPLIVNEPNATPYPGNGRLPSLIGGTRNVAAVLFRHHHHHHHHGHR
jgi:hypothetical protein